MSRTHTIGVLVVALAGIVAAVVREALRPDAPNESVAMASPEYVGRESCGGCHAEVVEKWTGSDHDLAMQPATAETVLGDFTGAVFEENGVPTTFFRRGEEFWVNAEGPDGALRDYRVAYTFGFDPLQQYLIEFPDGRYQCLTVAWDVERRAWYSLYPDRRFPPGDWMHWTGAGQNWNAMCAECHSTRLRKGYDPVADSYKTTWSEIDVSCEACHGPAGGHLVWARTPDRERRAVSFAGFERSLSALDSRRSVEVCAPCHSQRTLLADYDPGPDDRLLDVLVPSVLEAPLYFPDGQIQGEDYEYGSFLQSRMYHEGVRCQDCHDPHSTRLREDGNATCLRCHDPKYDAPGHHRHGAAATGEGSAVRCADCHMPQRVYMGIDERADHSIRIPRPDLSESLGTPNACAQPACHADQPLEWMVRSYRDLYGSGTRPSFAPLFADARAGGSETAQPLAELARQDSLPAIVRASALSLLGQLAETGVVDRGAEVLRRAFRDAATDSEPIVRLIGFRSLSRVGVDAASDGSGSVTIDDWRLVTLRALRDSVRAVRVEAARACVEMSGPGSLDTVPDVARELESAGRYPLDTATGAYNWANLCVAWNRPQDAETGYELALRRDPSFAQAWINFAFLLHGQGRVEEAEDKLRAATRVAPDLPEAWYDLALLLGGRNSEDQPRLDEMVNALETATALDPDLTRAHYNLALLYERLGRSGAAETRMARAAELDSTNVEYRFAAAQLALSHGKRDVARRWLAAALELGPGDPRGADLRARIDGVGGR
ncbi:MAG: tetratricopeptide repeat protein [Candidatus Eisenbacteria bacterium]